MINLPAAHQDQVVLCPSNAVVAASSSFCPYAALVYQGGSALSLQAHPEFTPGLAGDIMEAWQEVDPAPDRIIEPARKSLGNSQLDSRSIRPVLGRFLLGAQTL